MAWARQQIVKSSPKASLDVLINNAGGALGLDTVAQGKDEDWEAIALVARWLKSFRSATTQMSTTKHLMLSSTHAIFRGLQDSLTESLRSLPNNTSALLRQALLNAH